MTRPPRQYVAADFDYRYPSELVAQHPTARRETSRLLTLDRRTGTIAHREFREFPSLLRPGDVLVVNSSRVMPARLRGVRASGAPAEVLLIHPTTDGTWLAMVRPGAKLKPGRRVRFGDDAELEIADFAPDGLRRVRFTGVLGAHEIMERYGAVPLPPYIDRPPTPEDRERYQTVYADRDGSVAAPTAGLHFTKDMLDRIQTLGIRVARIVLHVGPGTFTPVEVEDPAQHTMHAEWYAVSGETADAINRARAGGGRVWAVGTTVARTLESVAVRESAGAAPASPTALSPAASAADRWSVAASAAWTDLFIHPPYEFRAVDAMLTNFHLPRSTLLMLVSAFAGHDHTMRAYREAVACRYRLYSYGDAMAIL